MLARHRHHLAVAALLAILLGLLLGGLAGQDHTSDEPAHLRYGRNLLDGETDRFDDSKMPVSALNALPARLGEALPEGSAPRDWLQSLFAQRLPTIAGTLLLALLVHRWARELYGRAAGLLALALTALDPNLIAHGRLATTDLWATLAMAASLWLTWRALRRPSTGRRLLAAGAFGLAQLAKYSNLFLFGLLPALAVASLAPAAVRALRERRWRDLAGGALRFLGWSGVFAAAALLAINAGFLFRRTLTPWNEYSFRSAAFARLQAATPAALAGLPVPVPYPWLEGVDWVVSRERRERGGEGFGNVYLRGELRRDRGFRDYYLWAYLYKVPLPTQALFVAALVALVVRRKRFRPLRDEIWLLLPAAFFFVYLNLFFRAQIGLRFLLVVVPLMHVFTGSLLAEPLRASRRAVAALGVALAWQAASVLSYFPHYIPYFNELILDRTRAYRVLADSNLDWGQNDNLLLRWHEEHPDAILEPEGPVAGTVVVRANYLVGVFVPERYVWLREHMEPVDHIGHAFLIYEVTEEDLRRLPEPLRERASGESGS